MKRLFGTDGIRGVAGESPLDPPTVRRFGAALATVVQENGRPCRIVIGRDTRESGPWLRDAVIDGLNGMGARAVDIGVIPTPGLAGVLAHGAFEAGVMISASHNPFADNGLKAFDRSGFKLSDDLERRIEALILDGHDFQLPSAAPRGDAEDLQQARTYVARLEDLLPQPGRLAGLRITLDCANGAACGIAPGVFRHHGADVVVIGCHPDGRNINLDCGSLHLDHLAAEVRRNGSDLGLAFDGDADRALAVDRQGRVADGDHVLYFIGRRLQREGRLRGSSLVATIMSNLWLEQRLAADGIVLHRAPVGDKYVLDRMIAEDAMLGGEQSGHVIFREHATTGDGILTGLLLADTLVEEGQPLDRLLDGIEPFPQVHRSVRVRHKPDLRSHARVGPAVAEIERALAGSGRVVLRYSGTEPVARVMIEGSDGDTVRAHAERLAKLIELELGG